MRRKISLYIGGQQVDLDDQSFILFNYTMDDLSNPTIVKNSFSQQITLKGTPANNRVFGGSFKADRRVDYSGGQTGIGFSASQKTPFTIYNEMNEILESGYVKLDSVTRKGADVEYKVTLFGGLGSFFYSLAYDDNGNKRNLASLAYLATDNPDTELNFAITKDAVQAAWNRLLNPGQSISSLWDVINFAPAYNGIPDGNFAPDKALVVPSDVGLHDTLIGREGNAPINIDVSAITSCGSRIGSTGVWETQYVNNYYGGLVDVTQYRGRSYVIVSSGGGSYAFVKSGVSLGNPADFATGWSGYVAFGAAGSEEVGVIPEDAVYLYVYLQSANTSYRPQSITIYETGERYTTRSGFALVNLAEAQDEWAVKDLRSYLQRPVFSMKAFWEAVCNPDNNGGYQVDASVLEDVTKFGNYGNLWMTLPMISSIGSIQQESGDLSLSMSSTATANNDVGRYNIVGSVPSGTKVIANINCRVRFYVSGAGAYSRLQHIVTTTSGRNTLSKFSVIFIQAVAYASDNSVVGGSKVKVAAAGTRDLPSVATACGYVPAWASGYERMSLTTFDQVSQVVFEIPSELGFTIEAQDVAYYKILVSVYDGSATTSGGHTTTNYSGNGRTSTPKMYADYNTAFTPTSAFIVAGAAEDTITYTSSDSLRSGATITKAMLLSSSKTPADYMLSFCKIFGLYFTYDNATRKVTIMRRNELYQDETIDLTRMVDRSKGIGIRPLLFDAKWYDFILEGVGGAFYDEYLKVEGVQYGIQRVNTGYDFNAEAVNLMDSVVFRNACTILARSKYFNYIFKTGSIFQPSPFLDKGNTYTLWSPDGDTLDTDISCPPTSANVTYYNSNQAYRGYDIDNAMKLELRSADNKPVDGADILVFLEGWAQYDYFKVTDDVPAMDVVNDGVPCWLLGAGDSGQDAPNIPIFQRYLYDDGSIVDSLDFGVPRQFDIPGVRVSEGSTLYERAWRRYLSDRYDENTKVMTCRVDFRGYRVNQELLRKFYWYDNSLWVLNAIKNHSLTTFDPVECEFIQVQDKQNYLNGQSY